MLFIYIVNNHCKQTAHVNHSGMDGSAKMNQHRSTLNDSGIHIFCEKRNKFQVLRNKQFPANSQVKKMRCKFANPVANPSQCRHALDFGSMNSHPHSNLTKCFIQITKSCKRFIFCENIDLNVLSKSSRPMGTDHTADEDIVGTDLTVDEKCQYVTNLKSHNEKNQPCGIPHPFILKLEYQLYPSPVNTSSNEKIP